MRVTIIYLTLLFVTTQIGCKYKSSKLANQIKVTDTLKPLSETLQSKNVDTIKVLNKSEIYGTWTAMDKEELTVEINNHFFYYREHHERLKYKFENDTISIFQFEDKFGGRPYLINDTLLLLDKDGGLKFVRLKK